MKSKHATDVVKSAVFIGRGYLYYSYGMTGIAVGSSQDKFLTFFPHDVTNTLPSIPVLKTDLQLHPLTSRVK